MVRIYRKNNISLFFLSPYADVHISDEGVFFHQRIFDTYMRFDFEPRKSMCLMDKLTMGIDETELHLFLSEISGQDKSEEYINMLIRTGIIE